MGVSHSLFNPIKVGDRNIGREGGGGGGGLGGGKSGVWR